MNERKYQWDPFDDEVGFETEGLCVGSCVMVPFRLLCFYELLRGAAVRWVFAEYVLTSAGTAADILTVCSYLK